jgi:16S rRNA (guanine527-N7)-methyltransferase
MPRDREAALTLTPVSRETEARLDLLAGLLAKWNPTKNLVAPSTLDELWVRHIADSLQLLPLLGTARSVMDLGSGAGFPGLPLAIACRDVPGFIVHSVESRQGKTAFQREAARITGAPLQVHAARIEDVVAAWREPTPDVITARALAPLADLLALAKPLLKTGTRCLFLKGQDVDRELTEATKSWNIEASLMPSATDPRGRIVVIETARLRSPTGG